MIAILLTKSGNKITPTETKSKTPSEQVGVTKEQMAQCLKDTDTAALQSGITSSVESAMKAVPSTERGTPYSVIVGSNGAKAEVRGAEPYENVKKLVDEVTSGKVKSPYKGDLPPVTTDDHIIGSMSAPIIIVEYSDYECPYCKAFEPTLKRLVSESNGNVAWVFRHWPIHQHSFEKLVAAECVSKIKGNDAFWKYSDLLFGLLKTSNDSVTDQL